LFCPLPFKDYPLPFLESIQLFVSASPLLAQCDTALTFGMDLRGVALMLGIHIPRFYT